MDVVTESVLRLSKDLPPIPAVELTTQTLGVLGAKGSGKTYLAQLIVEQLVGARQPVFIFDPVGNWGGSLRRAADGKSPGLPVVVLGGDDGDFPLEAEQGEALGTHLALHDGSVVLDLSEFSQNKRKTFVAAFFEALFRTSKRRRVPRMVVLEESHLFVPQEHNRGEERMRGAINAIVRLGRNYGIGCLLLSQRPQSVNKEVLNQVECLFVGQLRGPHERKAIAGWVTEQGQDIRSQLDELPSLSVGQFYCWSPSWLRVFKKIQVAKKTTFDGTRTPDGTGLPRGELKELSASEFLKGLGAVLVSVPTAKEGEESRVKGAARLSASASKMENPSNPSEVDRLRRQGEELLHELRESRKQVDEVRSELFALERQIEQRFKKVQKALTLLQEVFDENGQVQLSKPVSLAEGRPPLSVRNLAELPRLPVQRKEAKSESKTEPSPSYAGSLATTIALYGPLDRRLIHLLSGKSRSSSSFIETMRWLVSAGWVIEKDDRKFEITSHGRRSMQGTTLPLGPGLYDFWMRHLEGYDAALFQTLFPFPKGLTRAELSEHSGKSSSSSSFIESVRRLLKLGWIEGGASGGKLRVCDDVRAYMTAPIEKGSK